MGDTKLSEEGGWVMKILKVLVPCFILMSALLCWVGLSDVESANLWPNNRGELCWEADSGAILTLAITRTVGQHYLVHGTITNNPGTQEEYIQCVNGNAEIINNQVIMHFSTSGFDVNEVYVSSGRAELELATLNGYAEGIFISRAKTSSGEDEIRVDDPRVFWLISCP